MKRTDDTSRRAGCLPGGVWGGWVLLFDDLRTVTPGFGLSLGQRQPGRFRGHLRGVAGREALGHVLDSRRGGGRVCDLHCNDRKSGRHDIHLNQDPTSCRFGRIKKDLLGDGSEDRPQTCNHFTVLFTCCQQRIAGTVAGSRSSQAGSVRGRTCDRAGQGGGFLHLFSALQSPQEAVGSLGLIWRRRFGRRAAASTPFTVCGAGRRNLRRRSEPA